MEYDHMTSFRDVRLYPDSLLQISAQGVRLPVTYKRSWDDSFGARGWKLDVTIGDPEIIASTRETGQRINTSVFVHDILDHFLSGFGVSGHRSEAMALIQLSRRTDSDPTPDYEQMVQEDILHGRVNGEPLVSFLPAELMSLLPPGQAMTDREIVNCLKQIYPADALSDRLVKHFFSIGNSGNRHACASWKMLGLDTKKRTAYGLALQRLLETIDTNAEQADVSLLKGVITIGNQGVNYTCNGNNRLESIDGTHTEVDR